jgi:DNA-binding MarR family transcriptional regulator
MGRRHAGTRQPLSGRLHSSAINLLRDLHREDAAEHVGPARLSALSVLVYAGPVTLAQLARIEQVRPPTMSRIVKGLRAQRLATTGPDPGDRRKLHIEASPRGRSLLERARQRRLLRLEVLLASASRAERAVLLSAVRILEKVLAQRRI